MRRLLAATLVLLLTSGTLYRDTAQAQSPLVYTETFSLDSDAMTPLITSPRLEVAVHSRNRDTWAALEPMTIDHGALCEPPPATHPSGTPMAYSEAVFGCRDHAMTAIKAGGYGMIYLTPNHMVDFSAGEAVVRFDASTFRSSGRDWIDLWITPYDDHIQLPLRVDLPDVQGDPRRAVNVEMNFGLRGIFSAYTIRDHARTQLTGSGVDPFTGYETFLTPSAARRDTFELRISRTRLKFGMPAYNFWWIDKPIADLGWDRGVVQFGHHSYTPDKDCEPTSPCRANTWHWDNLSISPAVPFTIVPASPRSTTGGVVTFAAPAPSNAFLRFSAIGRVTVNGQTVAPKVSLSRTVNFASYMVPVPAGSTSATIGLSADTGYGGPFLARDFSLFSLSAQGPPPPTSTPTPGATATSTAVPPTSTSLPTSTPTRTPSAMPTGTPTRTPTPGAASCEVRVRQAGVESWVMKSASFCQAGG